MGVPPAPHHALYLHTHFTHFQFALSFAGAGFLHVLWGEKKGKRSERLQFARVFIEWIEKILIFTQRFQSFKSSLITFNLYTSPTYVVLLKKGLLSYKSVLVVHSWQHEKTPRDLCIKSRYFSGRVPRFYGGRVANRVTWFGNSSFG